MNIYLVLNNNYFDSVALGYAGKSYYTHVGNGANTLCLVKDPQFPNNARAGTADHTSLLHGVEYQLNEGFLNPSN